MQPYNPYIYRRHERWNRTYENFHRAGRDYSGGSNKTHRRDRGRVDRSPYRDESYYRLKFRQRGNQGYNWNYRNDGRSYDRKQDERNQNRYSRQRDRSGFSRSPVSQNRSLDRDPKRKGSRVSSRTLHRKRDRFYS